MNRLLDPRLLGGVVVGFLVALLGSCGVEMFRAGGMFGGRKERLETTIVLELDPATRTCRASDPIQLRTLHKKRIRWRIFNKCADAQWVEIRNFREKSEDAGLGAPVEGMTSDSLRTASAVPPNGTGDIRVQLALTIDREKYFKYDIANGTDPAALTVTRDPDIEMWDK